MEPMRFAGHDDLLHDFPKDIPSIASPVPSYRSHVSEVDRLPSWAREVAASLQNQRRASRASSIISTRTGTTTQTALSDAHSIDLNIDGQHFRISHDGSKVTTQNSEIGLPLYQTNLEVLDAVNEANHAGPGTATTPQARVPQYLPFRPALTTNAETDNIETDDGLSAQISALSRNPSYTPGKEIISVTKPRAVSHHQIPPTVSRKPVDPQRRLRRRRPIQLPDIDTTVDGDRIRFGNVDKQSLLTSPFPDQRTRSAEAVLGFDNHSFRNRSSSPSYIGRNASGLFPPAIHVYPESDLSFSISTRSVTESSFPSLQDDQATVTADSPNVREEGYAETYPPPAMDSENDVSVHYTRLIRSIDRDHRKALHERDKDMAKLRERLHEQDMIFRQTLKGRDFIIDDHKARLSALETQMETAVEKARNSTEDLWESRWKHRDFHLGERMRRMEENQRVSLSKALAERDLMWQRSWANKSQQLMERLQEALPISTQDLQPLTEPPLS